MSDLDCPTGTYCAAVDGGIICVLPSDTPIACGYDPFPHTADACEPGELPEGYVCRSINCDMYCYDECTCDEGRWQCQQWCRDPPRRDGGIGTFCGLPPRCRAFSACDYVDPGDPRPCRYDFDCLSGVCDPETDTCAP